MMLRLTGWVCAVLVGFGCGLPEDVLFRCEPERFCSQQTTDGTQYVCYPDDYCRPPGTPFPDTDGGGTDGGGTDGGFTDGGVTDGGFTDGGVTDGGFTDGGVTDGGCEPRKCDGFCGSLSDGCGATLQCGGCGMGSSCGADNTCQQCPPTDLPDDAFFDQNCDGIDGQLDGGIFLSPNGNDSAPGTRSQPVASLAKAFTLAQTAPHKTIYIASGTYDAGTPSMLWDSPVSLYGGYSADFNSRKATEPRPILQVGADGIRVTATGGGFTLERISVIAGNAAGESRPSVAMTVVNTQNLALRHASLRAGNGTTGTPGQASVSVGASGVDGAKGVTPNITNSPGAGAGTTSSFCSSQGGAGGGGGAHYSSGPGTGDPGTNGANNPGSAGSGGLRYTGCDNTGGCGCTPAGTAGAGGKGGNGANGNTGPDGTGGDGIGFVDSGGAWTARTGGIGLIGGNGAGGGGGGGGGALVYFNNSGANCGFAQGGGGGGAGGSGGCGGLGGTGGKGGGASIALILANARVQATALTLQPGTGGNGGPGGAGAAGGKGGEGGLGGLGYGVGEAGGPGGPGGRGGDGGTGGPGGGGGGGPAIGIYCTGSTVVHDGSITFVPGTRGMPAGNGDAGVSGAAYQCTGYP